MPVSEGYKTRLAQWVVDEKNRTGLTDRSFADRLGVGRGNPFFWRSGRLKQELSLESLEAIARYRGWTILQVKIWLFGDDMEPPPTTDVLTARIEQLEARVSQLESMVERQAALSNVISLLIQNDIKLFSGSPEAFARRSQLPLERVQAFLGGAIPTDDEFELLADGLNRNGINDWTATQLKNLMEAATQSRDLEENGSRQGPLGPDS